MAVEVVVVGDRAAAVIATHIHSYTHTQTQTPTCMASLVLPFAAHSRYLPRITTVINMAHVSKKSCRVCVWGGMIRRLMTDYSSKSKSMMNPAKQTNGTHQLNHPHPNPKHLNACATPDL